ncbi:MHflX, mitochondrial HflX GTPase [Ectocarpus siliculosus]|uniref:MHflX, mitochondrial HflX GTPase n=1 Tax=Ectocarpus siliculosus TaxID=2880 RepID=D7FHX0_ECTSI|nr:MHflX, mitochondrial HflX GTPase [Ectocarpus siliculosus]|eukprot:CBJ48981.1 MHflX, mitochondrial HflX GTPase [Ectocarpus siliculosus]
MVARTAVAFGRKAKVVQLRNVHPKFVFGSGKTSEMSGAISAADADTIFVNAPLSGQQQKALSAEWGGATVLDRFAVILDIFADRARTTEAKLQVELAMLKYKAAHLVKGSGSGFDRQGGGVGTMGGSGEKAIDTQRRLLRNRTAEVHRQLKDVERRRGFQRSSRDRRLEASVALVGYTNVGKSSLMNQLALGRHSTRGVGGGGGNREGRGGERGRRFEGAGGGAGKGKGMVQARNRVFDTLDPTVRSVTLPSRVRCVLVDTVGFIQDLPTDLVHSFKSTLEEVKSADVLLHVRDASVEPRVCEAHRKAVQETLAELGAGGVPTLEVWNKVDKERRLDPENRGANTGAGRSDGGGSYMSLPYEAEAEKANRRTEGPAGEGGSRLSHAREGRTGPDDEGAIRVSAASGQGLAHLLERIDAMLHLNGGADGEGSGRRFSTKPIDRYEYVRVLPGQSQQGYK